MPASSWDFESPNPPAPAPSGLTEAEVKSVDMDGFLEGVMWHRKDGGVAGGPTTVYTARKTGNIKIQLLTAYGALAPGKALRIDIYSLEPLDSNWANAAAVTSAAMAEGGQRCTTGVIAALQGRSYAVANIGDIGCGCIDGRLFFLEVP